MRRNWTIALGLVAVAAALALPGSAHPQALIIGTNGQTGDGDHIVAPVSVEQQSGDTRAAGNAGFGTGSAATAGTRSGDDGGDAIVGCLDGAAATGDSALTGSAGNCGPGRGGAAKAGTERDDTIAGANLGCITLGLVRLTSGGTQAGSCRRAAGGSEGSPGEGGSAGGGSEGGDYSGGEGAEGGSGVLSGAAGSGGGNDSRRPGPGDSQGSGACGGFNQLASLAPGSLPAWLLALGALGAFASGALFARRRSSSTLG